MSLKPEKLTEWIARRVEFSENRPSDIYVPFEPKRLPIGGWSLGYIAADPYEEPPRRYVFRGRRA